jgi:hypothetical protein
MNLEHSIFNQITIDRVRRTLYNNHSSITNLIQAVCSLGFWNGCNTSTKYTERDPVLYTHQRKIPTRPTNTTLCSDENCNFVHVAYDARQASATEDYMLNSTFKSITKHETDHETAKDDSNQSDMVRSKPIQSRDLPKRSKSLRFTYCNTSGRSHDFSGASPACHVAGKPGQLLCLTDGSQFCRPVRSDGSIDLVDLTEDDIRLCGFCPTEETIDHFHPIEPLSHEINSEKSTLSSQSLVCPLEYGYCGSSQDTVLVCEHQPYLKGMLDLTFRGKEVCTTANLVHSLIYRITVSDVQSTETTRDSIVHTNDHHPRSDIICGCCDGFDPDISIAGKCLEGSNTSSLFNQCCHPCRVQVPKVYQPCCCHQPDRLNCDVDPTVVGRGGYDDCDQYGKFIR